MTPRRMRKGDSPRIPPVVRGLAIGEQVGWGHMATTDWGFLFTSVRYFKDDIFEALRIVETAAQKHHLTTIECAFRWLVHHSALKMRTEGGNDGGNSASP
jgi:hypothetical protein